MDDKIFDQTYKNTRQRQLILSAFEQNKKLLSATEIYDFCQEKYPKIALSTVYRNLEILKKHHFIEETFIKEKNTVLYERVTDQHLHHLICLSCHKMIPIHNCQIDNISLDFAEKHKFQIQSHKLEFYGYCKQCQH